MKMLSKTPIVLTVLIILTILVGVGFVIFRDSSVEPSSVADTIIDETIFRNLLTQDDVEKALTDEMVTLSLELTDLYAIGNSSLPDAVADLDSWYGMRFVDSEGENDISLNVMDTVSQDAAETRMDKLQGAFGVGFVAVEYIVGERTSGEELNSDSIGSVIFFSQDDKVVVLQTSMLNEQEPLTDFDGLAELAQIISQRLSALN